MSVFEFGRGGGGGGGGDTPAVLSGHEIEVLYDNRPSSEAALSVAAGASSWARTFDLDLGRELDESLDDYDLRVRFTYTQTTGRRAVDLVVNVGEFRQWTEFATATGTTGVPVGNQKFSISRGVSSSNDLNGVWNRQGLVFRRGDIAAGNHVLGIVIPAGDSNSGYTAISEFRAVVQLVPPISALSVSGGGGSDDDDDDDGAGEGGGLQTVAGLPDPSEDYENQVLVNYIDRRAYICKNEPRVSGGGDVLEDLDDYYADTNANLRIFHDLPDAQASDEDTWIYIDSGIHKDKFYFGDTAPGATYAWYEDSPADALRPVCLDFVADASTIGDLEDLGADAPVVYLGQFQDEDAIEDRLHALAPDVTTSYYVAWNIQEEVFQIVSSYTVPCTVTDHWRWRNLRAEAIVPLLRPNADGSFPAATEELFEAHAVLMDWSAGGWHIKHTKHGTDTTARGTYTPSSGYGPGATIPGLHSTDTYRGVVDNTGQVTSPGNRDVCIVRSGSHVRLKLYLAAGNGGWVDYVHPDNLDRLLGPFRSLEEVDGRIGHFNSGDGVYVVVGYRLYRLTAFTPGTTATHSYDWQPSQAQRDVLIYYGAALSTDALDTPAAGNREVEGSDSLLTWNTMPDESYLASGVGLDFKAPGDVTGEDATITGSDILFEPPVGVWRCSIEVGYTGDDDDVGLVLLKIESGTADDAARALVALGSGASAGLGTDDLSTVGTLVSRRLRVASGDVFLAVVRGSTGDVTCNMTWQRLGSLAESISAY